MRRRYQISKNRVLDSRDNRGDNDDMGSIDPPKSPMEYLHKFHTVRKRVIVLAITTLEHVHDPLTTTGWTPSKLPAMGSVGCDADHTTFASAAWGHPVPI
jgi:hypothetical protein